MTHGRPLADWLDLSTGINPHGWPVPDIPAPLWARLPEEEDGLLPAARRYYGTGEVLAVAGSQAAIQALPALRPAGRVGVLSPTYAEHAHAWRRAGHQVTALHAEGLAAAAGHLDVLIVVNPNNPTGQYFTPGFLLDLHDRLAARGGWLVIDEAFMDVTPEHSLAPACGREGLIVLRSLGKFFGLAGARAGFVLADERLRTHLAARLGPWPLSGPARYIASQALADERWQAQARESLRRRGQRLHDLLARHGLRPDGGTPLFQWIRHRAAASWHAGLARHGILARRFDTPPALRLGLPGPEPEWRRLEQALARLETGNRREPVSC